MARISATAAASRAWRSTWPSSGGLVPVGAGAGDPQDPAQPLDAEVGTVVGDEVPAAGLHFTSLAKIRGRPAQDLALQLPLLLNLQQPGVLGPQPGQLISLTLRATPAPDGRPVRPSVLANPRAQRLPGDPELGGHGRVRALAAARAIQRDGVPPKLLKVWRLASHLDIPS